MLILGIETSCDETSAAVVKDGTLILSNIISSSLPLHAKTGGIIPENAARQQIKYIIPVIEQALKKSKLKLENIDAIAVTFGPGLIGSLLVGVETAKTLAYVWHKPLIPVNHLIGHIYANFIRTNPKSETLNPKLNAKIEFPALALIVSGGHTDLVLIKKHGNIKWLGGTRDDAAGEALDKIGRILKLPYPGGPAIEQKAKQGNPKAFNFPRPMIGSNDFDFSFSGLKTAVLREVSLLCHSRATLQRSEHPCGESGNPVNKTLTIEAISDLSASVQKAIIDVLVKKTLKAAQKYQVKSILLAGGVSANQKLRDEMEKSVNFQLSTFNFQLFAPMAQLCTDNAAMIASAAFFNYNPKPWQTITANPELYFG